MSVEPRSRWFRRLAIVVAVALCALSGRAVAGVLASSESGGNDAAAAVGADGESSALGPAVAESEGTRVAVSEVVADEDWTHVQEPDVITFVDGPPLDDPELPPSDDDPEPPASADDAPEPGEGPRIDLDDVVDVDDVAGELTVVPTLGVSVEVETVGHFARIAVPVRAGTAEVTGLVLDFGDGTSMTADEAQLQQIANGQTLTVLHEFEPTLTFTQQRVEATVSDADGEEQAATNQFATRAYFILNYSPLTVTSINDCDTFGKGDFELTWNQDGRERQSTFKLGEDDSHVEPRFRNRIFGVFYDVPIQLEIELQEKDPTGAFLLAPWKWNPNTYKGPPGRLAVGDGVVSQFGDHHLDVVLHRVTGDDDCQAEERFTMHLDMVDDARQAVQILVPPPPR